MTMFGSACWNNLPACSGTGESHNPVTVEDSSTIDLTIDENQLLTADVKTQMSITYSENGLKLSGDTASPGASKYYGTDSLGVKGWHDFPSSMTHNQLHDIASTDDHESTITPGYLIKANANGLPAEASVTDSQVSTAVSKAHDAVTVADSNTIDFTLSGQQITASVKEEAINHDALSGFVASEHVDHSTLNVVAGDGLSGGGTLTSSIALVNSDRGSTAITQHTANYDHSKLHTRQHDLASTQDHCSTIAEDHLIKANGYGLPVEANVTESEVYSAVQLKHGGVTVTDGTTIDFTLTNTESAQQLTAEVIAQGYSNNLQYNNNGALAGALALWYSASNGYLGLGVNSPGSRLQVAGDVTPDVTGSRSLGTSSLYWQNLYCRYINGIAVSSQFPTPDECNWTRSDSTLIPSVAGDSVSTTGNVTATRLYRNVASQYGGSNTEVADWPTVTREARLFGDMGTAHWDVGLSWTDLGQQASQSRIRSLIHLGNGICLAGTESDGKILRSIDYGRSWTDLGQQASQTGICSFAYLGNGICLAGTKPNGKILRSTDYGLTWTDLGQQVGQTDILCFAYLGNGIVVAGTSPGAKILRSTDYGLNWTDLGQQGSETSVRSMAYLGKGICLAGTGPSAYLLRSTDYGQTWTNLGRMLTEKYLGALLYLGNGICLAGTDECGYVFRSTDYGLTWTNLGRPGTQNYIRCMTYLGNGICLAGASTGAVGSARILRSTDYGLTWTALGALGSSDSYVWSMEYVGNGICLAGTGEPGHIYRSGLTMDKVNWIRPSNGSIYVNGLYVGIGTSSPTSALDVAGQATVDSLRIDQSPTSGSVTPEHYITISANGTTVRIPVQVVT